MRRIELIRDKAAGRGALRWRGHASCSAHHNKKARVWRGRKAAPGDSITRRQSLGATEAAMFVNGFNRKMLVHLIRTGLVTTQCENLKVGSQSIGRVKITGAGRQALEGC